jgi:hypothetical protein
MIVRHLTTKEVTIANGQTVSGIVETRGEYPNMGLALPAAFTGTALSFEVSLDGSTFQGLYREDGSAVSVTVAPGRSYQLPVELAPWPYFRIVSSASEGAARTLKLAMHS